MSLAVQHNGAGRIVIKNFFASTFGEPKAQKRHTYVYASQENYTVLAGIVQRATNDT